MGGQAQGQQDSQVYYDPDMGQYYTNTVNKNNPLGFYPPAAQLFGGMFQDMGRTYLNGFGQSSPALQQSAPYEYANTSLESLFPMIQSALKTSQGTQGSALDGLLANVAQGATSQAQNAPASSGAGRFL
jgi:hypothetical protein